MNFYSLLYCFILVFISLLPVNFSHHQYLPFRDPREKLLPSSHLNTEASLSRSFLTSGDTTELKVEHGFQMIICYKNSDGNSVSTAMFVRSALQHTDTLDLC